MRSRIRIVLASSVAAFAAAAIVYGVFRPRPSRLEVTARPGDDTLVINAVRPTALRTPVLDQYGRVLRADTAVEYRRISGDSIGLSSAGAITCERNGEAVVHASFQALSQQFVVRCRPVVAIEAASWIDMVVGDSARDLSFIAHGPDGRAVTELRGAIEVGDGSVIDARGTRIRAMRAGQTFASVQVGQAKKDIPILVYQGVQSFVGNGPNARLMAMHVRLARGDTIVVPLPKATFWVTYFSSDSRVPPPTIELVGDGSCTTGNGLNARRIEEGEYAKYCYTGNATRMMIAHGSVGADTVNGTVAIRLMW